MSYFGTCLDELIKRKGMKAVDLAKQSGVGESLISRYRKGEQVFVSADDLASLATAISEDPSERAELIRAHLLDECRGPGSELIQISVGERHIADAHTPYQVKLPADLERAMSVIRENVIIDKNVREIVQGLGDLLEPEPPSTLNEDKSNSPGENLEAGIVENLEKDLGLKKRGASKRRGAPGKPSQSSGA